MKSGIIMILGLCAFVLLLIWGDADPFQVGAAYFIGLVFGMTGVDSPETEGTRLDNPLDSSNSHLKRHNMKTREEIEELTRPGMIKDERLVIELLLDIRDILANPPIEITGEPLSSEEFKSLTPSN